jgi:serine/threonine-protein kinase
VGDNGVPFFTMKLVQGISFDKWLHSPKYAPGSSERLQQGLEIFLKVCDAVAYAHHRGVIHRDLKPENIMVAGFGQVYLMDWGLARLSKTRPASGERSQMNAFGAVGTPEYMAPEQARGNPKDMDERSDIFGLGAILYEIISGQMPYGNERNQDKVIELAQAGNVVPIEQAVFGVGVSRRICKIVERAVQPEPADRYQSVLELQDDVRGFLLGGLHLPRRVFLPGSVIVKEGDVGHEAYMILSGRCRAYREVEGGQENLLEMGAGDVFGEMALLLDEPRAASVVAMERTSVMVLDKNTMNEGLGIDGWTGVLVRALAQRYADLEQRVRTSGIKRG